MTSLFVALGILVVALMALLLWFVPHLLHQQAVRVAGETTQLREMLLDLLNEQEAVTMRQTQLGGTLTHLRDNLEVLVKEGTLSADNPRLNDDLQRVETRIGEVQRQVADWTARRDSMASTQSAQDNEAWSYVVSLLAAIQDRMGTLTQERAAEHVNTQASAMLQELEQEMQNLRSISEDIERLQWRLRRSLHERENSVSSLRANVTGAS